MIRPTFALAGVALLSGCLDTADCDPNAVGNVISSAICSNNGAFAERQDNLRGNLATIQREVERERIALSNATQRIRTLQAQQRLTAQEVAQINRQLNAQEADLTRLSRTSDPARLAQLRAQLKARRTEINRLAGVAVL